MIEVLSYILRVIYRIALTPVVMSVCLFYWLVSIQRNTSMIIEIGDTDGEDGIDDPKRGAGVTDTAATIRTKKGGSV